MRRWGAIAERANKVFPLLTSDFVRAAFALSTEQRAQNALHRQLVARLVPGWAGVPFFRATLVQRTSAPRPRLWKYADVDAVTAVLAEVSSSPWGADFDAEAVRRVWQGAVLRGQVGLRDEQLVQRVLWRALFEDHCNAVRGEPTLSRIPVTLGSAGSAVDVLRIPRALAVRANDVPAVRRFARTYVGHRLRRTLGV
jgi:hypothetical protein